MTKPYLGPVAIPDPEALAATRALCETTAPYAAGEGLDELFVCAMNEANAWHAARSPFFRRLWDGEKLGRVEELARLPYLHANFLKMHELLSIPREQVFLHLTSSGTTGQKSQMFFDEWTIRAAQRMVACIFDHYGWIDGSTPVNYLLFSYEPKPGFDVGTAFTDNYLCDFAPVRTVEYALKSTGAGGHEFDAFGVIRALLRFAEDGAPVRIFGFPAFLYFTLERMRAMGVPPLRLDPRSLVFLGGGWKGHAEAQIPKAELYARLGEQLGIPDERLRDGFGSVEHCVPYIECPRHNFHVPTWSRVIIRDVGTLKPLPYGRQGYLQLLSPYVTSVPAQSVMMGDLASLHPADACGCGLEAPWFAVHGRAGVSRNKSCAVAAAELLRGKR